ncbi:MAG: NAD(P)/FAD-dependent oxidoreductase, partial [Bacteroidota bacterium]
EINAYYERIMKERFLPSGRVSYFPLCAYTGDGKFKSMITGKGYEIDVNKKIVDTTYLKTNIPATHTPNFSIAPEAQFIPINDLPKIVHPPKGFVIIGGGKTGIDACLWLLEHQVDPDKITWIMPRDAWLLDRRNTQPTKDFFEYAIGAQANQFEAIVQAESIPDLFDRLETKGVLLRIDTNVRPKMFHGATVSPLELEQLRRIKHIVRMGRVKHIKGNEIVLDEGTISTTPEIVHVDCSASALSNFETKPIFSNHLITPQTVRSYQPVFSAAFIAHVEATYESEEKKNELCKVVPLPNHDTDWIKLLAAYMMNQYRWNQDPDLRKWLYNNRLDGFSKLVAQVSKDDMEKQSILKRMRDNIPPAMQKLQQFIAELS